MFIVFDSVLQVTAATAIGEVTDGDRRAARPLVFSRFVIVGMAACAFRFVRGERPGDDLIVGGMAVDT